MKKDVLLSALCVSSEALRDKRAVKSYSLACLHSKTGAISRPEKNKKELIEKYVKTLTKAASER